MCTSTKVTQPSAAPVRGHALCPVTHPVTPLVGQPAVEETSNAMALDGIMFEGVSVRVRRCVCMWICAHEPRSRRTRMLLFKGVQGGAASA